MGDFPQDELDDSSLHITPSSSALTALSSLNSPLTPSQLTLTFSLSDIPVVLFDDAYATDGRALTQTPCTDISVPNRDSYVSSTSAGTRTPDFKQTQVLSHRNSRVESQNVIDSFHASGSSDTLASMGTFGPRRINLKLCWDTRLSTGTSFPEMPSPTPSHNKKESFGESLPDTVALVGLTSQDSLETLKDLAPGYCLSGDDKTKAISSPRASPDSTWEHRPYKLPKISETPSKVALDRTASWIHSQEWESPQTQNHGFREIVSPVHGKQASILVTPTRRGILTDHDMNLVEASSPPRIRREHHECSKSSHQVETFHPKHFRQPEEDFAWIRDITVQCLVDQEGFRSAQPSFKLSGIVHLRSSLEPQTPGPATAQFRPITRQSFHFHHAVFETPPILRRVTTNDQETHDYVSRQAHLTLKCNGVYVVHGHETSSVDHDANGEAQKLSWQFEYLVDDRRLDVSGRIIEGEKVFTPLTFSCSPELLLPAQGKRVNIMHVFKKSIASKLFAEKLQPPGTPNPNDGPESPHTLSPGKIHGWGLHRRVKSHGTRQQDGLKTVNSRTGPIHSETNSHHTRSAVDESINEDEFGRHYRASSMGNHSQAASYSSVILRNRRHDSPIKNTTVPSTMPRPTRHIIPPSRLDELFDTMKKFQPPVPISICEPSTFASLTPRPRSRHA